MSNIIKAIWPPARRRAREVEAVRLQAAAEAHHRAKIAEKKKHEEAEASLRAYRAHVEAVDLSGVITRRGNPLKGSEIVEEVQRRLKLAADVKRDPGIKLADAMSDQQLEAITGELDQTALHWLLENGDPARQWEAAKTLLNNRANLTPPPSLEAYAMAVGEVAARFRSQYVRNRIVFAVMARAILLRSASTRWDRSRKGGLLPLSAAL